MPIQFKASLALQICLGIALFAVLVTMMEEPLFALAWALIAAVLAVGLFVRRELELLRRDLTDRDERGRSVRTEEIKPPPVVTQPRPEAGEPLPRR